MDPGQRQSLIPKERNGKVQIIQSVPLRNDLIILTGRLEENVNFKDMTVLSIMVANSPMWLFTFKLIEIK